jgi:hypothetical protein
VGVSPAHFHVPSFFAQDPVIVLFRIIYIFEAVNKSSTVASSSLWVLDRPQGVLADVTDMNKPWSKRRELSSLT